MKTAATHRPIQPGPGARCLYLGGREHKRVSCTAEALVVTNASAQTLRYPVARVARIVCSADAVDWSGPALALCLRAGIGITWMDGKGDALGSVYSLSRHDPNLVFTLEQWAEVQGGLERYQNWLKSRRMMMLSLWQATTNHSSNPLSWEMIKREWVYKRSFQAILPMDIRDLCLGYVAAQLNRRGLTPQLWGPQLQQINLAEDLCEMMWAQLNWDALAVPAAALQATSQLRLFESWLARRGGMLRSHIDDLQRAALKEQNL